MDHNTVCEFVKDHILDSFDVVHYFTRKEVPEYNTETQKWVGAFFKAHPWINKMMVVFDD